MPAQRRGRAGFAHRSPQRGLPGELPRFGPCAIRSSQDRWCELPIPLGRPGLYATVRRGADTRPDRRASPRPGKTASRHRRPTEAGHGTETCGRSGLSSTKGYVADFSWWGDPSLDSRKTHVTPVREADRTARGCKRRDRLGVLQERTWVCIRQSLCHARSGADPYSQLPVRSKLEKKPEESRKIDPSVRFVVRVTRLKHEDCMVMNRSDNGSRQRPGMTMSVFSRRGPGPRLKWSSADIGGDSPMSARERFASATPESQHRGPAGLRDWPRSLVRWLLGQSEEDREPEDTMRTVARFQNICISRETGAGGGTIARLV